MSCNETNQFIGNKIYQFFTKILSSMLILCVSLFIILFINKYFKCNENFISNLTDIIIFFLIFLLFIYLCLNVYSGYKFGIISTKISLCKIHNPFLFYVSYISNYKEILICFLSAKALSTF